jgi:hypothetical protein
LTESSERLKKGINFVSTRIKKCRERLAVLNSENDLQNMNAIWEAYFDLEEAILMAKVIFDAFNKVGKLRKLPQFSELSDQVIRAAFQTAEVNLSKAENHLNQLSGDATIESLRKARDQLKALMATNAGIGKRKRTRRLRT